MCDSQCFTFLERSKAHRKQITELVPGLKFQIIMTIRYVA